MSRRDTTPTSDPDPEENTVRRLLALAGTGDQPTAAERDRIAEAMWANASRAVPVAEPAPAAAVVPGDRSGDGNPSTPTRRQTRLVLWAAMLLVAVGVVGLMRTTGSQTTGPTASPDADRTTIRVGDTDVRFDVLEGYEIDRLGPASVTLTANRTSLRGHRTITIVQAVEVFGGRTSDEFFDANGLRPDSVASPEGSTAWLVSVDVGPDCVISGPCAAIAELPSGEPLQLVAGSYSRIEIYANGDSGPIVVVSEVAGPADGAALVDVELAR